jgi:hypothetical protein
VALSDDTQPGAGRRRPHPGEGQNIPCFLEAACPGAGDFGGADRAEVDMG